MAKFCGFILLIPCYLLMCSSAFQGIHGSLSFVAMVTLTHRWIVRIACVVKERLVCQVLVLVQVGYGVDSEPVYTTYQPEPQDSLQFLLYVRAIQVEIRLSFQELREVTLASGSVVPPGALIAVHAQLQNVQQIMLLETVGNCKERFGPVRHSVKNTPVPMVIFFHLKSKSLYLSTTKSY